MPLSSAAMFCREAIDPIAPGDGRLALPQHVRACHLALGLGLDQIDCVTGSHKKIGRVEGRKPIFLDVPETSESMLLLVDLAEGFNAGVVFARLHECPLQTAVLDGQR